MSTDPLILTVAPNGAYKQKTDHPAVPLSAAEIGAEARRCADAGAAMLHLHVRTPEGRHLLDAQAYREATQAVRAAVGQRLVVQVTTESGRIYSPPAQMALVRELHPEAVSVALRELLPADAPQSEALAFLTWLAGSGIMTQVILYDVEDLRRWQALRVCGDIPEAPWFLLFVLGRYSAGQRSQPVDLLPFVQAHTGPEPWAVCAFGAQENACLLTAAALGGHARMGFENNLLLPDGSTAPDNAALVRLAAQGAPLIGRPLASADQVRERFQHR
jgi:uncharacterized protein (DUF849 family)